MKTLLRSPLVIIALCLQAHPAMADLVTITVTNEGNSSFSLTPLWFGFDDGTFDLFTPGSAASAALEALAEEGIVSGLQSSFTGSAQGVVSAPGGFSGAPVIEPGETGSFTLDVNSSQDRFFNFASMVIPSNDAFIGSPVSLEIFDSLGNHVGGGSSTSLTLLGNQIWDAGTEVNNTLGAAFSTAGGTGTDENGVVQLLPAGGLDNFLNTGTPIGNILDLITPSQAVATITITSVPEPSCISIAILGLGLGAGLRRRRNR